MVGQNRTPPTGLQIYVLYIAILYGIHLQCYRSGKIAPGSGGPARADPWEGRRLRLTTYSLIDAEKGGYK